MLYIYEKRKIRPKKSNLGATLSENEMFSGAGLQGVSGEGGRLRLKGLATTQ